MCESRGRIVTNCSVYGVINVSGREEIVLRFHWYGLRNRGGIHRNGRVSSEMHNTDR